MISISSNLNIMIKAAEKASKSIIRDFGEVEKLQVSKKGPYDFVTKTDKHVEKILIEELSKTKKNYSFLTEESGIFNIGSDKTVSLNKVITIIESELNKKSKIDYQPRAFKDVDVVIPNLDRMNQLNWKPTTSIEIGVSETIKWYLKYVNEMKDIKFKFEYEK